MAGSIEAGPGSDTAGDGTPLLPYLEWIGFSVAVNQALTTDFGSYYLEHGKMYVLHTLTGVVTTAVDIPGIQTLVLDAAGMAEATLRLPRDLPDFPIHAGFVTIDAAASPTFLRAVSATVEVLEGGVEMSTPRRRP